MAQTKKKRSTKHRGNAAGKVEVRGRTGRKPTDAERAPAPGRGARQPRGDRFNRPPTWKGAANRSLIAVVIFVSVLVLFLNQDPRAAIALGGFLLILYIPMSFYTDQWLFKRRQRKAAEPKPPPGKKG